jgi:UDP-glucose-4-epimerase GalE
MRILVTGGAGYVGGFTARHLLRSGHDVVVLDDLSRGHREAIPGDHLVQGEISDRKRVGELVRTHRTELVMHFAALAYVGESVAEPARYWRTNVASTLALLETLLDCDVRRVVFSSTCAVYGETAEMPLREDAPLAPESPYATTKYAIERMLADFSRAYGMHYVALRYFNAAGASPDGIHGEHHEPETHLIPLVLRTALGLRGPLELFGDDYPTPDGTCIRDYVHVDDLAAAHEAAALALPAPGQTPHGARYNLGSGTGSSNLEVIRAAERVTGIRIPYRSVERRPGDTARLVASPDAARRALGWRPRYTSLEEIIETAWRWHQGHPRGYGS